MTAQPHETSNRPNPLALVTLEIETQRRQLDIAMSIVDACRLANDSALVPMYAPPDPEEDDDGETENKDGEKKNQDSRPFPPEADLEGALAMVWIILNGVSAQLEKLMFKHFEDAVAARRKAAGEEDSENQGTKAGE